MGPRSRDRGISAAALGRRARTRASMGPRSRDRGIVQLPALTGAGTTCFNGAAIARSRNSVTPSGRVERMPRLQWGRDRAIAELPYAVGMKITSNTLQWGRDRAIAELCRVLLVASVTHAASMGPRSRDRGISLGPVFDLGRIGASMGPRSRDRGIARFSKRQLPCLCCFNGAAIARSRN